jgi:hypothetical protein
MNHDEIVRLLPVFWFWIPLSVSETTKTKALSDGHKSFTKADVDWRPAGPLCWAQQHKRPRQHNCLGFANYLVLVYLGSEALYLKKNPFYFQSEKIHFVALN